MADSDLDLSMSQINLTHTTNGAVTNISTTDPRLDLWNILQDAFDPESLAPSLNAAWQNSPLDTLKIVFNVLDVREGKACNLVARKAFKWMAENHPETFLKNLQHVPFFGYYKDLPELLLMMLLTDDEEKELSELNATNKSIYGRTRCKESESSPGYQRTAERRRRIKKMTYTKERCKQHGASMEALLDKLKRRNREALSTTGTYAAAHAAVRRSFIEGIQEELQDTEARAGKSNLAAKWLPSEKSHLNEILQLYSMVAKEITGLSKSKLACAQLRKTAISRLRQQSMVIPEVYMSRNKWSSIPYVNVPGKSMRRNASAFRKHDTERFASFIDKALQEGGAGLHSDTIKPHELVADCIKIERIGSEYASSDDDVDEDDKMVTTQETGKSDQPEMSDKMKLVEGQWKALVQSLRDKGTLTSTLAVVDVSGSMTGLPMNVAIAIGLLTSTLCTGAWHRRLITFSEEPSIFEVCNGTFAQQVKQVKSMPWGMNTNYMAVFDLVLERAVKQQVAPDDMVQQIITISDMQFDTAGGGTFKTSYESIKDKYQEAGYSLPRMVFWNVNSYGGAVVTKDEQNTVLLSGYSANLLKMLLEQANLSEHVLSPLGMLLETISDSRYDRLTL